MKNKKKSFIYHIATFGCQMNEHDSEKMAGLLTEMGGRACEQEKDEEIDVWIINTCSVRENADNRFFGNLGQVKKRKLQYPQMIVAVCGCMMQQEHIVAQIRQKYPWVDLVFGTHNLHTLPQLLENIWEKREQEAGKSSKQKARSVVSVWDDMPSIEEGVPVKRLHKFKAFVNIMYGCNNFCTYCIVPYTRGREKSRHPEEVFAEVSSLVASGTKEIILLGQNVNSYGKNSDFDMDFADLIYRLDMIEGLARLRFMTSHPKDISDKLIQAFSDCKSLHNYIHLPVQSGSDAVLKRMNRGYTAREYLHIIDKLKEASSGIAISTDLIVGFPGESEADFEDTLALVRQAGFSSAFTFLYSIRKGTPAAEYGNQIPDEVKHERFDRLTSLINERIDQQNKAFENLVLPVLVEGVSKTNEAMYTGRTPENKVVHFPRTKEDQAFSLTGQIVNILITEAKTFSLTGEPVG